LSPGARPLHPDLPLDEPGRGGGSALSTTSHPPGHLPLRQGASTPERAYNWRLEQPVHPFVWIKTPDPVLTEPPFPWTSNAGHWHARACDVDSIARSLWECVLSGQGRDVRCVGWLPVLLSVRTDVELGGYTQRLTRWPPHISEGSPLTTGLELHHSAGRHPRCPEAVCRSHHRHPSPTKLSRVWPSRSRLMAATADTAMVATTRSTGPLAAVPSRSVRLARIRM